MSPHLHDTGEEYLIKNGIAGQSFDVGVHLNDPTQGGDDLQDSDDLAMIDNEPQGSDYSRLSDTFSGEVISGDYGVTNDSDLTFSLDESTQIFDAWFLVVTFQSDRAGDSSATDHLLLSGALGDTIDSDGLLEWTLFSDQIGGSVD